MRLHVIILLTVLRGGICAAQTRDTMREQQPFRIFGHPVAVVVRDVRGDSVISLQGAVATPIRPLSVVKLLTAAIWTNHFGMTGAFMCHWLAGLVYPTEIINDPRVDVFDDQFRIRRRVD